MLGKAELLLYWFWLSHILIGYVFGWIFFEHKCKEGAAQLLGLRLHLKSYVYCIKLLGNYFVLRFVLAVSWASLSSSSMLEGTPSTPVSALMT